MTAHMTATVIRMPTAACNWLAQHEYISRFTLFPQSTAAESFQPRGIGSAMYGTAIGRQMGHPTSAMATSPPIPPQPDFSGISGLPAQGNSPAPR